MKITKRYLQNIINEEMRSLKNSSTEPLDQMAPGGAFFEIVKGYLGNMDATALDFCQTLQSSGDLFENLIETIATFNLDPESGDHIIKAHDQIFGQRMTKGGKQPKFSGGFDHINQSAVNDLTQHIREGKNLIKEYTWGTGYYKRDEDEDEKDPFEHPLVTGLAEGEEDDPVEQLFDEETVNQIWELVNSSRVGSPGDLLNLALHKAGLDDHEHRLDIIKYYFPEEFGDSELGVDDRDLVRKFTKEIYPSLARDPEIDKKDLQAVAAVLSKQINANEQRDRKLGIDVRKALDLFMNWSDARGGNAGIFQELRDSLPVEDFKKERDWYEDLGEGINKMKITKSHIAKIINEEISNVLKLNETSLQQRLGLPYDISDSRNLIIAVTKLLNAGDGEKGIDKSDTEPNGVHPIVQFLQRRAKKEKDPKVRDELFNLTQEVLRSLGKDYQGPERGLNQGRAGKTDPEWSREKRKFFKGDDWDPVNRRVRPLSEGGAKSYLRKIINEEISNVLKEDGGQDIEILVAEFGDALEDIDDHGTTIEDDIDYVIFNWSSGDEKAWLTKNKRALLKRFS